MNKKHLILSLTFFSIFLASCSKTEATDGADITTNSKSCGEHSGIIIQLDTAWDGDTTINF